MERSEVYRILDGERDYQDERWIDDTTPSGVHIHSPEEWIVYMEDYLAEAKHILSRNDAPKCYSDAMEIIRKVTAMGVASMEQNGCLERIKLAKSDTFSFKVPISSIPDNEINDYVKKIAEKFSENATISNEDLKFPDGFIFHPNNIKE